MTLNLVWTLIISALIYGCGSQGKDHKAPSTSDEAKKAEPVSSSQALLLDRKADLPECLEANKHQLVYVTELEAFMTCSGKAWSEVTLKAPAAPKEALAGKDGAAGKDGKDGKDAPYVGPDEWIDPIGGSWFFLGAIFDRNEHPSCPAGSSFPKEELFKAAVAAGLLERYMSDSRSLWVGDGKTVYAGLTGSLRTGEIKTVTYPGPKPDPSIQRDTATARALCVKG